MLTTVALGLFIAGHNSRPVGTLINGWDEDLPRFAALNRSGDFESRPNVVAMFPNGALEHSDRVRITDELNQGMLAAKQLLQIPKWSFRGDRRIYFYFANGTFISHAPGGNVALIPFDRIRTKQAPWLHESMHIFLWSRDADWLSQPEEIQNARMPLWLEEGLADSLAMAVSAKTRIRNFSPLFDADFASVQKTCRAALNTDVGVAMLRCVGLRGKPAELFGPNRFEFAVPFYALSASFTTFLANRYGYPMLVRAQFAHDHEIEEIERRTERSMDELKASWLQSLAEPMGG